MNISAKEKITVKQSIDLIGSYLSTLGFTFEQTGNVLKVVPIKDLSAIRNIFTNSAQLYGFEGSRLVTYIRVLQFTSGDNIQKTISPYLSKFGTTLSDPSSGKLLITDSVDNVRNINNLIDQLDVISIDQSKESAMEIVTVKNLDSDQVIKFLQATVLDAEIEDTRYPATRRIVPSLGRPEMPKTRIQVMTLDQKNQILLMGEKNRVALAKKMVLDLDGRFQRTEDHFDYEIVRFRSLSEDSVMDLLTRLLPPSAFASPLKSTQPARSDKAATIRLKNQIDIAPLPTKGLLLVVGEEEDRKKIKNLIEGFDALVDRNQIQAGGAGVRIFPVQYLTAKKAVAYLAQLKGTPNQSSGSSLIDPSVQLFEHEEANSV
ncbi:MAG: hypothetical protein JNM63_17420, partial [Spirochaetia bacterium]|nr:hypothetical protein [Spirochaetia bacterium]